MVRNSTADTDAGGRVSAEGCVVAGVSPTQNTLKWMRAQGYLSAVVERWNPHARIRQDLFGIIDVLGVSDEGTLAVQSTSDSNLSARVKKMRESEHLGTLIAAGWTVVAQGWKKKSGRWVSREIYLSEQEETDA